MIPSPEQIGVAAYHRWQRRGGAHGRDWGDWFAAEQELLFAGNYEILAGYRLDGAHRQFLGDEEDRVCRFCEQAAPRATFSGAVPALPEALGITALFTFEECDECRDLFQEAIEDELETFSRSFRSGLSFPGRSGPPVPAVIPIAAYKGLVKAALALLPRRELAGCEDTIEWISNPDHEFDGAAVGDLECSVTLTPPSSPWAAVARRIEDDAPMPYLLGFVGTSGAVFQVHVPLCVRDEDLDGKDVIVPRPAAPLRLGQGVAEVRRMVIPMAGANRHGEVSRTRCHSLAR